MLIYLPSNPPARPIGLEQLFRAPQRRPSGLERPFPSDHAAPSGLEQLFRVPLRLPTGSSGHLYLRTQLCFVCYMLTKKRQGNNNVHVRKLAHSLELCVGYIGL